MIPEEGIAWKVLTPPPQGSPQVIPFKPKNRGYDFYESIHSFNGACREYEFDANGNIIRDVNKEIIELTYNHLNLPRKISFSKLDFLEYLYDAAGNKLRQVEYKQSNINKTTDFISNFVIVNNAPA